MHAQRDLYSHGDETSDEDISDDTLDFLVEERQRENVRQGRPPGGFLRLRQGILDERRQESKASMARLRQRYEEASDVWRAHEEGLIARPVEPPPDGLATPIPPVAFERASAEERRQMQAAGFTEEEIDREDQRRLLRYLQAERDFTEDVRGGRPTARRTVPPPAARPRSYSPSPSVLRRPAASSSSSGPFRPFNIEDYE